ncbi:MAG: hypothetical protein HY296_01215 [Thaumarchaeota archaeon]|nr:hypothetical protein [Nitrososphaerota archaeon]
MSDALVVSRHFTKALKILQALGNELTPEFGKEIKSVGISATISTTLIVLAMVLMVTAAFY